MASSRARAPEVRGRDEAAHFNRTLARSIAGYIAGTALTFCFAILRDFLVGRRIGVGNTADLVLLATNVPQSMATSLTANLDASVLPALGGARPVRVAAELATIERGLVILLLSSAPILLIAVGNPLLALIGREGWVSSLVSALLVICLFAGSGLLSFRVRCRLGRVHRFFWAGLAPAAIAIGTMMGLGLVARGWPIWWAILGSFIGAIAASRLIHPFKRTEVPVAAPAWGNAVSRTLPYVRRSLPVIIGAGVFALASLALRAVAGFGPPGTIAGLEFATRAFNIPNTLLVTSAAAVLLPTLVTAQRSAGDGLIPQVWWAVAVMTPMTLGLVLAGPLIARFFLGSAAPQGALDGIRFNLTTLAAGLPPMMLGNLLMRSDQAQRNFSTSLLGALACFVATAIMACALAFLDQWTVLGAANTGGLAALLAVACNTTRSRFSALRVRAAVVPVAASGVLAIVLGLHITHSFSSVVLWSLFTSIVTGWLLGELLVVLGQRWATSRRLLSYSPVMRQREATE